MNTSSTAIRQYAACCGGSVRTVNMLAFGLLSNWARMSTIGLIDTRAVCCFPWTSTSPGERKPGRSPGAISAMPRHASATRLAPRVVVAGKRAERRPCHIVIGPHCPNRHNPSANRSAMTDARNGIT